jgi:hypothetical protein
MAVAMKLLVCGGRAYADWGYLHRALDFTHSLFPISIIIHGDARPRFGDDGTVSADIIADTWARLNGISVRPYTADWSTHGNAAGPIRNSLMLRQERPDAVAAFAGGRGTADMVSKARAAGVPVWEF